MIFLKIYSGSKLFGVGVFYFLIALRISYCNPRVSMLKFKQTNKREFFYEKGN